MINTTVEMPSGEVDIKLDSIEEMFLRMDMPSGIDQRVGNNNPNSKDLMWFEQVVHTATDLDIAKISNIETLYIVDCTVREINDGMESQTYDEFVGEDQDTDFIGAGTLGVR